MISISSKKWEEIDIKKNTLEKYKQNLNFSEILTKLILIRNFDQDEIFSISNKIELNNVFLKNKDFIKAVSILEDSIKKKEYICILGDYDVDGSTATSLLVRFLDFINHPHFFYIPDRTLDGYGASKKLFEKLILKKPKLFIMVDCGSNSVDAINFLNEKKIKSIVIDHHEINKPFPKANCIINPKKNNGYQVYDYLCASTLTYFFLDNIVKKIRSKYKNDKFLIYVLIATVCDVMPLRKLNRLIAIKVLKEFDISNSYLFKEIYNQMKKNNKININDFGYLIGPILNAGGRLGKPNHATKLLSTDSEVIIKKLIKELINLNEKRKIIENRILDDIDFNKINHPQDDIIILYEKNINEGLIGIIAARLTEHFDKPSIVITESNNILKGSARSTPEFNIGNAVKSAYVSDLLINGGGHSMAAGFTLKKNDFLIFKNFIKDFCIKTNFVKNNKFKFESVISSTAINNDFYDEIKLIEPFGTNNKNPTFLFKKLRIIKPTIVGKNHVSCFLKSKMGHSTKSIAFNSVKCRLGEYLLNYKKELDVIGQIIENNWNNKNTLQLSIKDLII